MSDHQGRTVRDELLRLGVAVRSAASEEQALMMMRAATGLTITDPAADARTLAARIAAQDDRAARARAITCPGFSLAPGAPRSPGR